MFRSTYRYNIKTFHLQERTLQTMCRTRNCCGCIDLRTGCIVIAIIEIIIALGCLGITALKYTTGMRTPYMEHGPGGPSGPSLFGSPYLRDLVTLVNIPGFVIGVVLIVLLWASLLVGVCMRNPWVVLGNLIGLLIFLIIRVVLFFVAITMMLDGTGWPWSFLWPYATLTGIVTGLFIALVIHICLDIYFAVVIGSYYASLKSGDSQGFLPYPV